MKKRVFREQLQKKVIQVLNNMKGRKRFLGEHPSKEYINSLLVEFSSVGVYCYN